RVRTITHVVRAGDWASGRKIVGRGRGSYQLSVRSVTTPTTLTGCGSLSSRIVVPTGLRSGQNRSAAVLLITAARAELIPSPGCSGRPASTSRRIASNSDGDTTSTSARGISADCKAGRSSRLNATIGFGTLLAGSFRISAAFSTSGNARSRSSSASWNVAIRTASGYRDSGSVSVNLRTREGAIVSNAAERRLNPPTIT